MWYARHTSRVSTSDLPEPFGPESRASAEVRGEVETCDRRVGGQGPHLRRVRRSSKALAPTSRERETRSVPRTEPYLLHVRKGFQWPLVSSYFFLLPSFLFSELSFVLLWSNLN